MPTASNLTDAQKIDAFDWMKENPGATIEEWLEKKKINNDGVECVGAKDAAAATEDNDSKVDIEKGKGNQKEDATVDATEADDAAATDDNDDEIVKKKVGKYYLFRKCSSKNYFF